MEIKTGVDVVYIPKFRKVLKKGPSEFLKRVYLPQELENQEIARLVGIFAAKEAVMKALNLPKDSWHLIKIGWLPSGIPKVDLVYPKLKSHSLSISHDGNYGIAQFVALVSK